MTRVRDPWRGLDDALAEPALEVAVDGVAQLAQPGRAGGGARPAEPLEELRQRGRKLGVGGQRHLVDVGLGARDRLGVEARESVELARPPKISFEEARGFTLWATRSILSGDGSAELEVARTNLRRLAVE